MNDIKMTLGEAMIAASWEFLEEQRAAFAAVEAKVAYPPQLSVGSRHNPRRPYDDALEGPPLWRMPRLADLNTKRFDFTREDGVRVTFGEYRGDA